MGGVSGQRHRGHRRVSTLNLLGEIGPGDALLQQHEVGRRGRGGGRLPWSVLGTLGILPVVLFPFLLRGHVAAKVVCPDNDAMK